jgi:hypothetical protein
MRMGAVHPGTHFSLARSQERFRLPPEIGTSVHKPAFLPAVRAICDLQQLHFYAGKLQAPIQMVCEFC